MAKKLQKCGTEEEMREVAGKICKNYLHGLWTYVEPSELQFRRISGGLSNFIYVVGLPEDMTAIYTRMEKDSDEESKSARSTLESSDDPRKVLIRIYGQVHGERAMDAIVTESVIFTLLSERRLGPKLFGVFPGGRIEEFIPGRSLYTKELADPALSMKIAEKTAAIHSMDIPLTKEPSFLWKNMNLWLKNIKDDVFKNGVKGKNEDENMAIARLKEVNFDLEIMWLKKYLSTIDSPVVFCHNDLQEGNIMLLDDVPPQTTDEFETSDYVQTYGSDNPIAGRKDSLAHSASNISVENQTSLHSIQNITESQASRAAFLPQTADRASFMDHHYEDANTSDTVISHISDSGEPRIYLIDFEYCSYNHRGFDIANHFQEWVYEYTNPDPPYFHVRVENTPTLEQKEIFIKEYLKHYMWNQGEDKTTLPDIDSVNKLLGEVEAFSLASHLLWSLWSIVNAQKSEIPFGYWEYGLSRYETYLQLKQEIIKKDKYGLPQKRKIEEVDI